MKKLLSMAVCTAALVGLAADSTPIQVGAEVEVGVIDIEIPAETKNVLVPVAFGNLNGAGDADLANLVKTTNLAVDDQLFAYINGSYQTWKLVSVNKDGKAPFAWEKTALNVEVDENGEQTQTPGNDASSILRPFGSAIWIVRADATTAASVTVYGAPVTANRTFTIPAGSMALFGNPETAAKEMTAGMITGMAAGDKIYVVNANAAGMMVTYTYNGSQWKTTNPTTGERVEGLPTLSLAGGAWYQSTGKSPVTINWDAQ